MRLAKNQWLGFMIVMFGVSIFLGSIGIGHMLFGPLFFLISGYFLRKYSRNWLGAMSYIFAGFLFLKNLFSITFSLFGYVIATFLIYAGYKLIKGEKVFNSPKQQKDFRFFRKGKEEQSACAFEHQPTDIRSFFIGDLRLIKTPFDLNNLNISGFIGDVKIDLSKAIIPEGESTIVISGLIGDVDIYVPSDLDVSISSVAFIGDMNIIGHKKSGISNKLNTSSANFEQSTRRVKISISLFIGDVDVRYL